MSYEIVSPNTTVCADTPQNRREFKAFKAAIQKPHKNILQGQIAKENKQLRSLSTFLPGFEPDRYQRSE